MAEVLEDLQDHIDHDIARVGRGEWSDGVISLKGEYMGQAPHVGGSDEDDFPSILAVVAADHETWTIKAARYQRLSGGSFSLVRIARGIRRVRRDIATMMFERKKREQELARLRENHGRLQKKLGNVMDGGFRRVPESCTRVLARPSRSGGEGFLEMEVDMLTPKEVHQIIALLRTFPKRTKKTTMRSIPMPTKPSA